MRAADGLEIDLVVNVRQQLWAIEVKLTCNPSGSDMARLNDTADLIGVHRRFLVTRSAATASRGVQTVCDLAHMIDQASKPLYESP